MPETETQKPDAAPAPPAAPTVDPSSDPLAYLKQASGYVPPPPQDPGAKRKCTVLVVQRGDYPGFGACGRYWESGEHKVELTDLEIAELRREPARAFMSVFVEPDEGSDLEAELAQAKAQLQAAQAELERVRRETQAQHDARHPEDQPASGRRRG